MSKTSSPLYVHHLHLNSSYTVVSAIAEVQYHSGHFALQCLLFEISLEIYGLFAAPEIVNYEPLGLPADMW